MYGARFGHLAQVGRASGRPFGELELLGSLKAGSILRGIGSEVAELN